MLLLKRGGETIYNGPLGFQSADMISYFEAIPGRSAAIKSHTVRHSSRHLDSPCNLPDHCMVQRGLAATSSSSDYGMSVLQPVLSEPYNGISPMQ